MKNLFPRWMNAFPTATLAAVLLGGAVVVSGITYYFTPSYWEVGYQPEQPIAYSHQLHANELGIDCRYCHSYVEDSRNANVPSPQVCMNCHTVVDATTGYLKQAVGVEGESAHWTNVNLQRLRDAYASGAPVEWKRVHKLPDYAQFNHAIHVNAGVSCFSCHGRVDQMPVVHQVEPLSMSWCLDCHRDPGPNLVGVENVTKLWEAERIITERLETRDSAEAIAARVKDALNNAKPPQQCAACHY